MTDNNTNKNKLFQTDPDIPLLADQSGNGAYEDAAAEILLDFSGGHAAGNDCLCERRQGTGKDRFTLRNPFSEPYSLLCCPWHLSDCGEKDSFSLSEKK